LEIIKIIAQDLKRLEEYETLAINEIEAWLRRAIMPRTNNECYATAEDYFSAQKQNKELVKTLKEARKAIISSDAKMPAYWQDSVGQVDRMETVDKIEEFIKKFSDQ
jgi:hypothetical protein